MFEDLALDELRGLVFAQIFGNTLEEGVFAIDPAGLIGAFFVGDED